MIKKILNKFYSKIKYDGNESLTKASIIFIIILDIFVFIMINQGIDFQTRITNNVNVKYDSKCRSAINIKNNNQMNDPNSYFYKTNKNYLGHYRNKSISTEDLNNITINEQDNRCEIINNNIQNIIIDKNFINLQLNLINIEKEIKNIKKNNDYIQKQYSNMLLEDIAKQDRNKSIIEGNNSQIAKQNLDNNNFKIEKLIENKNKILNNFYKTNNFIKMKNYIENNRKQILEDYESEKKYYKIKKSVIEIMFILPLILLFYFSMMNFKNKEKYSLYIISKNIFFITLIPFLWSTSFIIYNLIPHTFISRLISFFYNLKIPFVVYYLLIFIAIAIFTVIILKLQKRQKENKKRLVNSIDKVRRYELSKCSNCFKPVNYIMMDYCPNCGNTLKVECKNCLSKTIKNLKFCYVCGKDKNGVHNDI